MARLLLRSPGVKGIWLAPLMAATGCIYVDAVNQAPHVEMKTPADTHAFKGETITLKASATDDLDSAPSLQVLFTVEAVDDQPLAPCDFSLDTFGVTDFTANVTFYRTGMFSVRAATTDRFGTPSNSERVMIQINNAPPAFENTALPIATSPLSACKTFTAGEAVPLLLKGKVADADAKAVRDSSCAPSETVTYTWRITGTPSTRAVLTAYDGTNCTLPTAASGASLEVADEKSQVCLWTDDAITAATQMYSVVLEVSDGTATVPSTAANIPVAPDAPPCITGTQLPAGSYVVDRSELQTFQVTGVSDDRDSFGSAKLTYRWSVWRENDPVWRVVPMHPESSYSLDVSGFGVGENVKVRVEAVDRTAKLATSCDPDTVDACSVNSCVLNGAVCNKWKTWNLELR